MDESKSSKLEGRGTEFKIDWGNVDTADARPANVTMLQTFGSDLILTLGHVSPTAAMSAMPPEETSEYTQQYPIPVKQVSRFVLPVLAARNLLAALSSHIEAMES